MKFLKKNLFSLVSALLVVIAMLLALAPFVKFTAVGGCMSVNKDVTGFQAMFGAEDVTKLVPVALVAFILMVVSIGGLVVNMIMDIKCAKWIRALLAVMLIVAAIMIFCVKSGYMSANDTGALSDYYKIGAAAVIGGILLILAAAAQVFVMLKQDFKVIK